MSTENKEMIEQQLELLAIYRRTLATFLKQQAQLGEAYTPPGVIEGIRSSRDNICRIKSSLRNWGVEVPDYPEDRQIYVEHNYLYDGNSEVFIKDWYVSISEFATSTKDFWRSGRLNIFDGRFQKAANTDSKMDQTVTKAVNFVASCGVPFFKGEAWVAGGIDSKWIITTYRFIIIEHNYTLRIIPFNRIHAYEGKVGILSSKIKLNVDFSNVDVTIFDSPPKEEIVELIIHLKMWSILPAKIQSHLSDIFTITE